MFKWSEVIDQNEEKLIEAMEQAFRDAVDCRHMRHIVEIYQDGTIRTWACATGSNSFSSDSWNGKSKEVGSFCFQYMDVLPSEEDFRNHMTEAEQKKIDEVIDDECMTFREYIYSSGKYEDLIEEVENEWLDWYKDEYAYVTACTVVHDAIITESEWEELA